MASLESWSASPRPSPDPWAAASVFSISTWVIPEFLPFMPAAQAGAKYHPSISGQRPSPIYVQWTAYLLRNRLIVPLTILSAWLISFLPHFLAPTALSAFPINLNGEDTTSIIPMKILMTPAIILLTRATILMKSLTNMQSTVNMNGSLIRMLLYGMGLFPP